VQSSKEKGDELEAAVEAIERHILQTSPALAEETFIIESKKVISADGVHHEIDLFVTFDLGPGYRPIFIFECKNWEEAVGKNEIIVFSEKIDAAGAQHGYFVAKSFTKDAEAQATKDSRMTLLIATVADPAAVLVPFNFHTVNPVLEHVEVRFFKRGAAETGGMQLDLETTSAESNSHKIDIRNYLIEWANEVRDEDVRKVGSHAMTNGAYERTVKGARCFELPGSLLLDGADVAQADLTVMYKLHVYHPSVIASYEVASRGRVISLGPTVFADGTSMVIRLVESRPNQITH